MFRVWFKKLYRKTFNIKCKHEWEYPFERNKYKRKCIHCHQWQFLFWRKYPMIGEPAYTWEDVGLPEDA